MNFKKRAQLANNVTELLDYIESLEQKLKESPVVRELTPKKSSGINGFFEYKLIATSRRLTFDIIFQHPAITFHGEDDGPFYTWRASNGYEIISRSRMDIQTERLWLRGGTADDRSGSMVFSDNEKRDAAQAKFNVAIQEWLKMVYQQYLLLADQANAEIRW